MQMKNEIQFADYTPEISFNGDKLSQGLLAIFKKGVTSYLKYIPPKKRLNWDKSVKGFEAELEGRGLQRLLGTQNPKLIGMDDDLAKDLVNPKVHIYLKNGKIAVKQYEYLYSKFDKFIAEFELGKFQVTSEQYMLSKQNDKKKVRKTLFLKMFPNENFDKKWSLTINLPKRKRKRANTFSDDSNMSLLSDGNASDASAGDLGNSPDNIPIDEGDGNLPGARIMKKGTIKISR